jgi:hypothetical protein
MNELNSVLGTRGTSRRAYTDIHSRPHERQAPQGLKHGLDVQLLQR